MVYIYFGFLYAGLSDPVGVYTAVEEAARDEIMKYGGCISHHHGVGKLRKKFLPRSIGNTGIEILKGVKKTIELVPVGLDVHVTEENLLEYAEAYFKSTCWGGIMNS